MREGKRRGWLRERIEDREEREAESSHKTRRRMKCASSEGRWLCYPSPCGVSLLHARCQVSKWENQPFTQRRKAGAAPIRSLSLPQQSQAGLKLPFHCGQRFGLSGKVKNSEKSGLVKGGHCLLSGPPPRQEHDCSVLSCLQESDLLLSLKQAKNRLEGDPAVEHDSYGGLASAI